MKRAIIVGLIAVLGLVAFVPSAQATDFRWLARKSGYGSASTSTWTKNYRQVYFAAISRGNFITLGWSVKCNGGFHTAGGKTGVGQVAKAVGIPYGQGRCYEGVAGISRHHYLTVGIAVRH